MIYIPNCIKNDSDKVRIYTETFERLLKSYEPSPHGLMGRFCLSGLQSAALQSALKHDKTNSVENLVIA